MYLPRSLISKLYIHLQKTRHPLSPPVLILVALEPDALCACRILTRLLKHDYIPHKIHPIAGYSDLEKAGAELVTPMMESQGGSGGLVVCLGVGGMVDLGETLGLETAGDTPYSGVEVWIMDAHRPWNLGNVFGGFPLQPAGADTSSYQSKCPPGVEEGQIGVSYTPGAGGIVVFDDGDVQDDLTGERSAYLALLDMPDVDDDGRDLDSSDEEDGYGDYEEDEQEEPRVGQKRKSWSDGHDDESSDDEDDRPRQRRRSNSVRAIDASYAPLEEANDVPSRALSRIPHGGPNQEDSCPSETPRLAYQATRSSPLPAHSPSHLLLSVICETAFSVCVESMKRSFASTTIWAPLFRSRSPQ